MAFLIGGANTLDDAYEISNSLMFNGSSTEMEDTLGTPTNIKKFTISLWFKRSALYADISTGQSLISCYRGAVGNPFGALNFGGNDHIEFFGFDDENTTVMNIQTGAGRFRDVSAWYHIVFAVDTTQGTAANRVKVYVNGVQDTDLATTTYPAENKDLAWNQSGTVHYLGHYQYTNATWMNGYESEFAFVDGSQLTSTSFGKTNEYGIWVPIDFKDDITWGDNGYYLEFKETGTSANSSGIGADTSGNTRHFTPSGFGAAQSVEDSPTNNFCTWNNLDTTDISDLTFSEGNLKVVNATGVCRGTLAAASGKWYWEIKQLTAVDASNPIQYGVADTEASPTTHSSLNNALIAYSDNNLEKSIKKFAAGTESTITSTMGSYNSISANDIIMFAFDADTAKLWVGRNGTWLNSGDPAAGSNEVASTNAGNFFTPCLEHAGVTYTIQANFGNPQFSISSANSDAAGYGQFEYTVPTGFYSLCTKNLARYG